MGSFIQVDDNIDMSSLGKTTGATIIHNKQYKIIEDLSRKVYFKVRELSRKNKAKIQLITPINGDKMYAFLLEDGKLKMHGEVLSMLYS